MRLHMCASCSRRPAAAPPPAQPARLRVVVSAAIGKRRETSGAHAPLRRFAASRLCCVKLAGGTRKTRAVKEFNVQCKVNLNFYTFIVQFTVVWMYSVMVMWLFETFYSRNIAYIASCSSLHDIMLKKRQHKFTSKKWQINWKRRLKI